MSAAKEAYPRRTGSIFEQCVRHIRGLDKHGFRKLRREANAMFGKDTRIVLPDDSDKSNASAETRRDSGVVLQPVVRQGGPDA